MLSDDGDLCLPHKCSLALLYLLTVCGAASFALPGTNRGISRCHLGLDHATNTWSCEASDSMDSLA